jgi:hypothetical protein
MTLREKQSKFASMVGQLLQHIDGIPGYAVTLGDAYRAPTVQYGSPKSLHRERLAIDLNLFINGVYQTSTEAYTPLGEYWEGIGGAWGGRFLAPRPDGNHFSLAHGGRK